VQSGKSCVLLTPLGFLRFDFLSYKYEKNLNFIIENQLFLKLIRLSPIKGTTDSKNQIRKFKSKCSTF